MTRTRHYSAALLLTLSCSSESPSNEGMTTSGVMTGTPSTTVTAPPVQPVPPPATVTPPQVNPPAPQPPAQPPAVQPPPNPVPTGAPSSSTTTETATTPTTTSDATTEVVSSEAPQSSATSDDMAPSTSDEETGGGSVGECVKGSTKGNEVVFIGESFIAASSIPEETTTLAIQNGSLAQGDKYLDFSVSGTRMGDGAIPRQYTQAQAANPIRFVLMNGGGNDCLQANDPNAPIPAAEKLYEEMAADGVEKVVYFFYPDAAGMFGGPSSQLQTCLDTYRPKIKALCDSLEAPKCYWIDLAETSWAGNESAYTSDGIHPNAQGSKVTAQAIWDTMAENCVAP